MRKLLFLLILIGLCPLAAQAQDPVPRVEVFGGYSYLRTGSGYDQDLHGWNTAVSGNLSRHFAIKADFAGHYDAYNFTGIEVRNFVHTFLFGPQVNIRATERINPFVHALVGVAHDRTKARLGTAETVYTDTGFAFAVGGGVDAKWGEHVSWRVFQTDYLLTRYQDPTLVPLQKRNIHHFRFSTGVVFH
jgi:opacity protein-like surface antigen